MPFMKLFGLMLVAALVVVPLTRPVLASTEDSAAVVATVEAFHAALKAGDTKAATALLAPDVVVLEGGHLETREEYLAHHLAADIAFTQAVDTQRGPLNAQVEGPVAWTHATSTSTGTFQSRDIHSAGVESMVLSRTPNGWRIRSIHWSSHQQKPQSPARQ
jgi:ketosteroid isomerase-like protein